MTRVAPLALLVVLGSACGLSPRAYCEEVNRVTCERLFACTTSEAERATLERLYADPVACTKALQERSRCATLTEQQLCSSGTKWEPANAAACVDELRTLACEQLSTYRPTCAPPCQR